MPTKPPLGVKPEEMYDAIANRDRMLELARAIHEYTAYTMTENLANQKIDENKGSIITWCKELIKRLKTIEGAAPENTETKILSLLERWGSIDGGHHKQWLLDQIARVITGDGYNAWKTNRDWDKGIPP